MVSDGDLTVSPNKNLSTFVTAAFSNFTLALQFQTQGESPLQQLNLKHITYLKRCSHRCCSREMNATYTTIVSAFCQHVDLVFGVNMGNVLITLE
jgi:hypothetical protein